MQIINPAAAASPARPKDKAIPSADQKSKTALIRLVHEAGLHRRLWHPADARRPSVIVTFGSNPEVGAQWFRKMTGESPAGTIDLTGRFPGSLKLGRLKSDPSLLPILFGKAVRRAAIRLAQAGVVSCVFAEQQPFKMGKFDADYIHTNKQPLCDLFKLFADAESRLTLASILKHRITGDHGYLRIARYPEYEHPHCRALPGDTACDVGAHDGQSSIRFANQVGATGRVLALEPDALNVAKIEAGLQSANVTNVQIVQAALAESPGTLSFSGGQGDPPVFPTTGMFRFAPPPSTNWPAISPWGPRRSSASTSKARSCPP